MWHLFCQRNSKNPESSAFRIFLSKPLALAYHRRAKSGAYHQPFGLYLITRQRVSTCGLMIYKAYRFDDIPQQVADDIHAFGVMGIRKWVDTPPFLCYN